MRKYKKLWITLGILLFICVGGYAYFFAIPKHTASQAIDSYMKAQKISNTQVKSKIVKKDWKGGGYSGKVQLEDDSEMMYEYYYDTRYPLPYHVNLVVFLMDRVKRMKM